MKLGLVPISALLISVCNTAFATVYFDSLQAQLQRSPGDGQADDNSFAAASFTANSPDFNQIQLQLTAANPSDGGSVQVYLVGDDGTGGSVGLAGKPNGTVDSSGVPLEGILVGTIADSMLSTTPSLASLYVTSSEAAIATNNDEYWVHLVFSSGSSASWEYSDGTDTSAAIGLLGQGNLDQIFPNVASDSGGVYDLVVDTPEPGTMAVLGVGIAALGFVRRRISKPA